MSNRFTQLIIYLKDHYIYLVSTALFIELRPLIEFGREDTEDDIFTGDINFCPLLIGDTVVLFGGRDEPTQIAQLYPWGLRRVGTLPFKFQPGRCLSWNNAIYLCFGHLFGSTCYKRLKFCIYHC